MTNFIKFLSVFVVCVFSVNANIKFEINRDIALFSQVYFEKDISEELYNELKSIFITSSENQEAEKQEFIECLINKKTESKYITGRFINLWDDALLKYDRVFDNNLDILNDRKEELIAYYNQNLSKIIDFDKIFDFYQTSLTNKTPFLVYIYPTNQNGIYAERFGNNLFLRFNYGNKTNNFCLIYRKICNRLFETILPENKSSMEKYFMSHHSKYARPAYFLLNEVLAYTIGEVWIHSILLDKSDSPRQKHQDENINKISIALFPIVQKYLKSSTPLDNNFYNEYIKLIELQYPNSNLNYDIMLSKISLIVENGIDLENCINELKFNFPIDQLKFKPSVFSTIFIGNNLGDPALVSLQSKIPNKENEFLFVTNDSKGKLFIIIKSNDNDHINHAIRLIKKQKEIKVGYIKDL